VHFVELLLILNKNYCVAINCNSFHELSVKFDTFQKLYCEITHFFPWIRLVSKHTLSLLVYRFIISVNLFLIMQVSTATDEPTWCTASRQSHCAQRCLFSVQCCKQAAVIGRLLTTLVSVFAMAKFYFMSRVWAKFHREVVELLNNAISANTVCPKGYFKF